MLRKPGEGEGKNVRHVAFHGQATGCLDSRARPVASGLLQPPPHPGVLSPRAMPPFLGLPEIGGRSGPLGGVQRPGGTLDEWQRRWDSPHLTMQFSAWAAPPWHLISAFHESTHWPPSVLAHLVAHEVQGEGLAGPRHSLDLSSCLPLQAEGSPRQLWLLHSV